MRNHMTYILIGSVAALISGCHPATRVVRPPAASETRQVAAASGTHAACAASLADCPMEGCGGDRIDAGTNVQKNRTEVPATTELLSVAQFKQRFREKTDIPTSRESLSNSDKSALVEEESNGVTVEGVILDYAKEGVESCNCYVPDAKDFHVWLGADLSTDKWNSIVVELTPRIFDTSDRSISTTLGRLKKDHTRVRVVGWPTFDPLHPTEVGDTRYSRWEVHPILDIQTQSDGGDWVSIFE